MPDNEDVQRRRFRRRHLLRLMDSKRQVVSFFTGMMILLAAFITFFVLQQEDVQRSILYPYYYRDVVEHYSHRYGVDEYTTAAVIKTESKFQQNARSSRGAVGLMQLMPETAEWIAKELEDQEYTEENLRDPYRNIRYGSWYLGELLNAFDGNEILALAAYNAGRGNVRRWMMEYGWDYSFNDVEKIPYKETREYVKSVLKNQLKYKQLYSYE